MYFYKKKIASSTNLFMFNDKREIISWVPLGCATIAVLLNALYMIASEVFIKIVDRNFLVIFFYSLPTYIYVDKNLVLY